MTVPAHGPTVADDMQVLRLVRMIATQFGVAPSGIRRVDSFITGADLGRFGYLGSFPELAMAVVPHNDLQLDGKMPGYLTPSACYGVYLQNAGRVVDGCFKNSIIAKCFRHEEATHAMRRRSFEMLEFVVVGEAETVKTTVADNLGSARQFFGRAGLNTQTVVASDPFTGMSGRIKRQMQIASSSKLECVWEHPTYGATPLASANLHGAHFTSSLEISTLDGRPCESGCVAFGIDRVVTALRDTYGDLESALDQLERPMQD